MTNRIESLNKENYDTWVLQAKAILVKAKLWKYVEQEIDLTKASDSDIEGNLMAISELILIISPSELKQIKNCKTAHVIWKKLNETHASKCPARKATLLKQLILTKYERGNDIREHLNNFMDVVDKLEEMNVTVHEDLLSIMMLYSLSSEFETFRVAIESRDNLPKPDELKIKIIEEFQARKNTQGIQSSTSSSEQESFYAKTNLYCKICKKKGHMTKNCWKNYKNMKKNNPNNKGNKDNQKEFNSLALLAKDVAFQKQWILDSGCTSHMCYNKEYFREIEETNKTLKLASKDHNTNILGKGRVDLLLNTNKEIYLHNTLFIPDLCTNLLSIGKITDAGNTVLFKKDEATVRNPEYGIVIKAKRTEDGLYAIFPKNVINAKEEKVNFVKNNNISEWHSRLGHMNYMDMKLALKNESLIGLDFKIDEQPEECEVCIKAKMKAMVGKPRTDPRTSEPLQIVHSDLCGPMSKASCAGNKYFVTFIDDFTRYSRVFCIKTKNEVIDMFKVYKAEVENFMEKKIKCLQSDNGTEYCNNEFNSFLKENGITRRLSAPYTPHQNGIAERKNRTLLEKARSLMIESNAPMYLWGEAIYTANYLSNRSPNNRIGNVTPFEKWVGRKPRVAHLNKFGAKAFVLLKGRQNLNKFDAKAIPGVFIGYSEISKAFRIWVPSTHKVMVTKNVNIMQKFYYDIKERENLNKNNIDETRKEKQYVEIEFLEENINSEIQENQESEEDTWAEAETQTGNDNNIISEENEIHSAEEEELPMPPQNEVTEERTETRALRDHSLIRKPVRFDDFVMNAVAELEDSYTEPKTYKEAMLSENRDKWEEAMQSEMNSLKKNNTWELAALPKGRKALSNKWIYKIKRNPDGTIERYKARLVIKGFSQREGIDYDKTFSPVARLTTIRAILGIAANENLNLQQFDVTTAFLNGTVEEEIYMVPPNGLRVPKGKVCRLLRSLYGLKQAPRCWNDCIHKFLIDAKFQRSEADPCLYVRIKGNSKVIVGLYVDDGLVASTNSAGQEFLNELERNFKITTKPASFFLGMEINRNKDGSINLSQRAYVNKVLKRFGMENCKPVSSPTIKMPKMEETNENEDMKFPYRNCVGALAYLMVATRPDICYAVSVASRHLEKPRKEDIVAVKRILRFLKGTLDKCLTFYHSKAIDLMCYSDADHGGDPETGHSTTGMVCLYAGTAIAWKSQKQTSVALSTTEAELVAASETTQEIVWLQKLLADLTNTEFLKVTLCIDNESAVKLSYNPPYECHRRTKHISLRHFYIRECVSKGELVVKQVAAQVQLADMFTKPLYGPRFNVLSYGIGLRANS